VKNLFWESVVELDTAFSWWMDIYDEGLGYQWTRSIFKVN
jgi:hypothetical protein